MAIAGERGGIGIVLMLGRLFGFRLDVELSFETDLFFVRDGHVQKTGEVIQLLVRRGGFLLVYVRTLIQ